MRMEQKSRSKLLTWPGFEHRISHFAVHWLVGFPVLTRAYDNNGRCPRQKLVFGILQHQPEHVSRKIHHCTFRARKLEFMQNFSMNDLHLHENVYLPSHIFECHFYYCTNSLSSLHIPKYHCTFCA